MKSPLRIWLARLTIVAALIMSLAALGSLAGPAFAADQGAPIAGGQARVWFLRQLLPGEAFHAPMVYVNGAPIAKAAEGTAFYRDFAPGRYTFSIENCIPEPGTSQTLDLQPGHQWALQVTQDDNGPYRCSPPQVSYLQQVSPQQAQYLFAQVTNEGAK
jgi:hypothetical protein